MRRTTEVLLPSVSRKVNILHMLGLVIILASLGALAVAFPSYPQPEKPPDNKTKTLEEWIEALKDRDQRELHNQARQALGPGGPYTKGAVPALIELLNHKKPDVRWDAAVTLAYHGPAIVPVLVRDLKRPEALVREGVAATLGFVRPKAIDAVPALLEVMKDPVTDVRAAAAWGLGRIGSSAGNTIPALVLALGDKEDRVREAAAAALFKMGRKSKPAIPALILALKDNNASVRKSAAQTLWKIGPDAKAAVAGLIAGLKKKDDFAHWAMAQALGGIGQEAREAVPTLIEALKDKDHLLRGWATHALREIGPGAKPAVPALIAAVKDKNNPERDSAIEALGKIGPDASPAVPVLMEALAAPPYLHFRYTVAEALGGIGPEAKAAVPALTAIAFDRLIDYQPARRAAAQAIMKIDPVFGAKQGIELAYLDIRLGKVPALKLAPRAPVAEERKQRIKKLIAELAEVDNPDFGMSAATLSGPAFAPLSEQGRIQMLLLTNQRMKTASALRSLVEIGPDALPFLLEALADKRPTKLKIEPLQFTCFGSELKGNPLNALERRVLSEETAHKDSADDEEEGLIDYPYTLKVADICFVAIGQIVGRPYSAIRYQPSGILIINSPLEKKGLRERVRALWSSNDPAQKLFDSLLLDYATEGIFNGKSLDGWSEGNDSQVQAAMRLLYYFPKETAPLIAARLRSFEVQEVGNSGWMQRDVNNRVRIIDFLGAVSWCPAPPIVEALTDIAKRTNDPVIKETIERRRRKNP